jgi:hypothetical protein
MLHLQFSTLHLKKLSNSVHGSQIVFNVSQPLVGAKTSYISFVNRGQPAFCSQLTGLPVVFSWIVLMSTPR